MNREEQVRLLLEKYDQQACNEEERQQLYDWLEEQALAGKAWEFTDLSEREALKNKMRESVLTAVRSEEPILSKKVTGISGRLNTIHVWIKFSVAAAAIIAGIWGLTWLTGTHEIVAYTSPGSIKRVILPDGSTVWLNNNSELAYQRDFTHNRTIELRKGEAFFEVKKDPDHVFKVKTHEIETTVLGTSFSARITGTTGDLKVSVVTGKVMVSREKRILGVLLPYQRLRYNGLSGMSARDSVLADEADGWIRGGVLLQNASLPEVIQWLQDNFKVTINNKRSTYKGEYFLQAKSDIPLPEVLKILNLLGKKDHVQFLMQDQTIIIQ